MRNKIRFHNRLNVRLFAVLLILFALTVLVVGIVNENNIRRLYEETYTERVLLTNALVANIVNSEDVNTMVELMKNQDRAFKDRQIRFFHDREELFRIADESGTEERQQELMDSLAAFHSDMEQYKTEAYWSTLADLRLLKEISHSAYMYVMSDTGLVADTGEKLYTYIMDADDASVYDSPDIDGLGTCYVGEQALEDVYLTGRQMDYVEYYLGDYGELYFAYAPIMNESGEVIAVLGTDLDLGKMHEEIANSIYVFNLIFIVATVIIILAVFIFINSSVIRPLTDLTNTAYALADGNVYAPVPESTAKRRSEIGILARAVSDMSLVYQNMIKSTGSLFAAASVGKLDIRNDESAFKGDVRNVVRQINDTMDAMALYLNSIPEGILILGKDFQIHFRNEHFLKRFGDMQAQDFLSALFFGDHIGGDDGYARESKLKDRLTEMLGRENEHIAVWIGPCCYSVAFREIVLSDMPENSLLVIASDITDLMEEKENAQAAAKAKSDFLSRMSHEMRTPMNAIIGMTKIAGDTDDVARLRYCLSTIGASSNHLLGIINDVLDMSKIEAGKFELEHAPMNIETMLVRICHIVIDNMDAKRQDFRVDMETDLELNYDGDELRLSQVITNLLSNAVKFTAEGGEIALAVKSAGRDGDQNILRFSVSDTGIGMTEDQCARLFNAFEQADGSISRKFGGTGLGLAISKSIVEKMEGQIWVESAPGIGSTFYFEVKLDREAQQEAAHVSDILGAIRRTPEVATDADAADGEAPDLTGVRILLAEDVAINREIFLALLEDTHIAVDTAENGRIALDTFRENPDLYDLIVMDVQMPEMDGIQATQAIRALDTPRADSIPIIAMTANAFKEDVERCLACGMNDHLAKPIDEKAVIEKILHYTGSSR